MNIYEKLQAVQSELKAPKGQFNSFGKYKYRSCEDILEAVKPVLAKHKAAITVGDEITMIGDRFYIKATARFYDTESDHAPVENTALAREAADKKGMDESQITGTASSYARKYCLNGLLLIDDTKDSDTVQSVMEGEVRSIKKMTPQELAKAAYPSRDEMMKAIKKKYPDGSQEQVNLANALGIPLIDMASDEQVQAVWNKVTKK